MKVLFIAIHAFIITGIYDQDTSLGACTLEEKLQYSDELHVILKTDKLGVDWRDVTKTGAVVIEWGEMGAAATVIPTPTKETGLLLPADDTILVPRTIYALHVTLGDCKLAPYHVVPEDSSRMKGTENFYNTSFTTPGPCLEGKGCGARRYLYECTYTTEDELLRQHFCPEPNVLCQPECNRICNKPKQESKTVSSIEVNIPEYNLNRLNLASNFIGYKLQYRLESETDWIDLPDETPSPNEDVFVTVNGLDMYTEYAFRCQVLVTGIGDEVYSDEEIITSGAGTPTATPVLKADSSTDTTIKYTWPEVTTDINGELEKYKVHYWKKDDPTGTRESTETSGDNLELTATDLTPYTWYVAELQIINSADDTVAGFNESPMSAQVEIQTKEGVPLVPPPDMVGLALSDSVIRLDYSKIPVEQRQGVVIEYKLECQKSGPPGSSGGGAGQTFEATSTELTGEVTGLELLTTYECAVQGCTQVGCGPKSQTLSIKTLPKSPIHAADVRAEYINATAMSVEWDDLQLPHWGRLEEREFCLITQLDGAEVDQQCVSYDEGIYALNLTNLEAYTEYEFFVQCKNSMGPGPLDKSVKAYTDELPPEVPPPTINYTRHINTIDVRWLPPPPSNYRGIIRGHTVEVQAVVTEADYNIGVTSSSRKRRAIEYSNVDYTGPNVLEWSTHIEDPSVNSITIPNLFGNTLYNITIASNTKYNGSFSPGNLTRTKEGVPLLSVVDFKCFQKRPFTLDVCWIHAPPVYTQGTRTKYQIYYEKVDDPASFNRTDEQSPDEECYQLMFLRAITKYRVWVGAWTSQGEGLLSPQIVCETDEWYPDEAPKNVKASSLEFPFATTVSWDPISDLRWHGIPKGYRIYHRKISQGEKVHHGDWKSFPTDSTDTTFQLNDIDIYATYELRVAAYTRIDVGPLSSTITFSTCRAYEPVIDVNYYIMSPFIKLPFPTEERPRGLLVNVIEEALLECALTCSSFNQAYSVKWQESTNYSTPQEAVVDPGPLHAVNLPKTTPQKFVPDSSFAGLVSVPGFVLLEMPDPPAVKVRITEEGLIANVVDSLTVVILYIAINCAFGAIFFCVEPRNAEMKDTCYSAYSIFEGMYLAVMTSTTVGYGDKYPFTFGGRVYIMFWTLLGLVITGICIGNITSALSASSVMSKNAQFPSDQVAVMLDTPEYHWGKKQMNYSAFQDHEGVVSALEDRKLKYAVLDQYTVELFRPRLIKAGVSMKKMYPSDEGIYGALFTGHKKHLDVCMERACEARIAAIEAAVEKLKKEMSSAQQDGAAQEVEIEEEVTLINYQAPIYQLTLIILTIALLILFVIGSIYEFIRRKRLRDESNRVKTRTDHLLAFQAELRAFRAEYLSAYAEMLERVQDRTDEIFFRHGEEIIRMTEQLSKMMGVNFKYVKLSDIGMPLDELAGYKDEMRSRPKVPWHTKAGGWIARKWAWIKLQIEFHLL